MGVKWDAAAVLDCCNQAEAELAKGMPHVIKAAEILRHVNDVENMPGYITQPALFAANEVKWAGDRAQQRIDRVRSCVPEKEAARARFQGRAVPLIKVTTLPGGNGSRRADYRQQVPERRAWDGTSSIPMRLSGGRARVARP